MAAPSQWMAYSEWSCYHSYYFLLIASYLLLLALHHQPSKVSHQVALSKGSHGEQSLSCSFWK